ncbi:hypothetical protein AB0H76_17965 [Nocardia sp. NPDC050712]|uniref:hypothetical protein n=1 Tax=Nocardia sp. NPDC050712 TaxID=3155518 RepID=UPI00340B582E
MIDEPAAGRLSGRYHDVLLGPDGRVLWDRGWHANAIVGDCRRLLAALIRGAPAATGIVGLQIGAGSEAWDNTGPPPATSGQTKLVDPKPFTAGPAAMRLDFLTAATVSGTPTNRLQIHTTLGPNLPNWPDANHTTSNLREFGLVATLDGATVLLNYVTHSVIAKDPASTLQRTIWLTF